MPAAQPPWDIFLVAGEASGDRLGAALIRALRERTGGTVRFAGVGGPEMATEGVASLFPIDDLSIIGFSAIPSRLPKILRLIGATAAAVVARRPQVLVIIDSPAFSCRVAKRVRAADPTIAIVEYVSLRCHDIRRYGREFFEVERKTFERFASRQVDQRTGISVIAPRRYRPLHFNQQARRNRGRD